MNWLISRPGASRWLLLGLLLIQVGCSSTTFLYNRLDTLIGWYLSDYVTLSREQRKDFDGRVNELLDWHRAEELPRYVVWLTAFEASLEDGLSESELDHLLDQVEAAADRLQERVLNLLLDFGTTLSAEQRLEFVQTLQSDQANLEEKYLNRSDEEYIGAIEKQFQKNLGRFLGSLSEAQKAAGVIAASAGNQAQGMALSASKLGIQTTIVMPKTTPDIKVDAVRGFGGNVVLHGSNFDEAKAEAERLSAKHGYTFVPPFDDDDFEGLRISVLLANREGVCGSFSLSKLLF